MPISAIIVDDEPSARRSIRTLLERHYADVVTIVAEAKNANKARAALLQYAPDVLFLDIHMPGEDGLHMLASIHPELRSFLTVFVTAYDQYVLQAMKERALDFLIKPLNPEEFHATIQKIQSEVSKNHSLRLLHHHNIESLLLRLLPPQEEIPTERLYLPVQKGAKRLVEIASVLYCRAQRSYCIFHLDNGESILISRPLREYEQVLTNSGFVRIHHSCLVNPTVIQQYTPTADNRGGGSVTLNDGTVLEVSRRKKEDLRKKLSNYTIPETVSHARTQCKK
jgi:two-component system LytT family response regulator